MDNDLHPSQPNSPSAGNDPTRPLNQNEPQQNWTPSGQQARSQGGSGSPSGTAPRPRFSTSPQSAPSASAQTGATPVQPPVGQKPGWMFQQQYIQGPGMSNRSKIVAGLFGIFFGLFGVHNFYLGNTGKAVGQLLLTIFGALLIVGPIISEIWGLTEGIYILASHPGSRWHTDVNGLQLQD